MMRGSKSFIGLLVVLLALGAYLYFVESKRTPGAADEKQDSLRRARGRRDRAGDGDVGVR